VEVFHTAEDAIVLALVSLLGAALAALRHLFTRLTKVEAKATDLERAQNSLSQEIVDRLNRVEARQDRMLEILAKPPH
jgi:predicted metalloprotease